MRFTTINDVIAYVFSADPEFRNELTDDQVREIIHSNRINRYEEITDEELTAMVVAAYVACGVDEPEAVAMLRDT